MNSSAGVDLGTASLRRDGLRACGTCVKAKVKCVPTERGICQRCQRLDKTCLPSVASARKRLQSSQVAQLEQKLDNLVSFLTKDNAIPASNLPIYSPDPLVTAQQAPISYADIDVPGLDSSRDSQPAFLAPLTETLQDPFGPSLSRQDAAFLLLEFRASMCHHFPFVVIPPSASSDQLREERPMLWKAVMTAASYHNSIRQEAMGWKLMEEFSTRVFMRAEKSLDLLQALLVHITWYHYHSAANPQATNLFFMAKSLLNNLGYNRPRASRDGPKLNLNIDGADGLSVDAPESPAYSMSRTLEEWRALAGVFYISALSAWTSRRMDRIVYTPHLDSVCRSLSEMCEYESDRLILPLVLIQNVVLKMSSSLQELDLSSPLSAIPIRMYMTTLKAELDSIKAAVPNGSEDNVTIRSCYQIAEISLYEVGLYRVFWQDNDKELRLKTLYSCLVAVKAYFDTHFSPGIRMPASFPYFMWIQNGYALLQGAKLSYGKADGWDSKNVFTILDYANVVDRLTEKLEAIIRLRTPHGKHEIFERYIKQIGCGQMRRTTPARNVVEGHQDEAPPTSSENQSANADNLGSSFVPVTDTEFQNQLFLDDIFWQGLMDTDNDWMMAPMMFGQ